MTKKNFQEIRTRIAPSPTGLAHVGNIYVALFNFAFARQNKGKFVLRIEDTDIKRHVPEAEQVIYDAFKWLGLENDEGPNVGGSYGPYRQSERLEIYQKYIKDLIAKNLAYEKEGAVWFKVNSGKTSWDDLIRGKIEFDNKEIKDFVILKSDKYPSYNFAVTIDDWQMKISHVIRAEEHISNTPRQIMIYQALDAIIPQFAHLPLLRNTDHSKISKRKNPVSVSWYQEQGYLPEALINFLCLMGWSHPEGKDIFSIDEFIKDFSFQRISKSAPIFDFKKLDWMDGIYIREKSNEDLIKLVKPFMLKKISDGLIGEIVPLIKERLTKLSDFPLMINFFIGEPKIDVKLLLDKGGKDKKVIKQQFELVLADLEKIKWETVELEKFFREITEKNNWILGKFFMAVRIAITGKIATPPLFEIMVVLGKDKTTTRLASAIKLLG
ncbi:MAG: glutamate--tRNA ligase [Candidatus Shapirobacteria bacterium]|nr:glutamate--tRNA ligase [Candidatus Shapirobacteria bacterium]